MNIKRLLTTLAIALSLLLIPLIAMFFTKGVQWSTSDFLMMGVLLTVLVVIFELLRNIKKRKFRILAMIVLLFFFLLVWAELAVGVFGTPFAGT
ncbi:hypothetical protein [Nonlabens xiamenensis]|uniref:hypothetical protein n=1 Tax=Nonlabens xiamenensis TaxID=2341043 RepID=UPI000F6058AE|nr:hypothetical protein [Nonlabens xiamenensis]